MPDFRLTTYDPKRESESPGGGSNITVLDAGWASVLNGELVIEGSLIGIALNNYDADGGGVAVNIDGCWFLPVKATVYRGDVIYFHDSAPDYLDNVSDGGIPVGIAIEDGPAYSGSAVAVSVKLVPNTRIQTFDFTQIYAGDQTASIAEHVVFVPSQTGRIIEAGFTCGNTGADGTDPLSMEMELQIAGATIFTTKPKVDPVAGAVDGCSTFIAGTGVTVGVINTAADDFTAFQLVEMTGTLIRTTPEDEMADFAFYVKYLYT